ncbi:MAG: HipA domain-containing protein [Bacteroidales bacterium]|nr:HipA domain-containing protein [Bacteroidales bacterium]
MGALEYEPAVDVPWNANASFAIESLIDVAQAALNEKKDFASNLQGDAKAAVADILRIGTSAGGQRAKAIIAYNPTTGEVRSGQVAAPEGFDYYLIKLDGVSGEAGLKETNNHGRLEYSFYLLAKACGITMSYCDLIEEGGRAHFITKRFDRKDGRKIHMQTLCGIAHYDYRILRGYSYEQAFDVMRRLRLSYLEAQQMFRRMVFNVVIRNQDDHTKNISFLMDSRGYWTLSPAYDIAYAYNPRGSWTAQHQMSINGKFDVITRNDLLDCAQRNNIKNAEEIIDSVVETCASWPNTALNCGIPSF